MPLLAPSSPVCYPPSSSPSTHMADIRPAKKLKTRHIDADRDPLQEIGTNIPVAEPHTIAGFLVDDSSEDEIAPASTPDVVNSSMNTFHTGAPNVNDALRHRHTTPSEQHEGKRHAAFKYPLDPSILTSRQVEAHPEATLKSFTIRTSNQTAFLVKTRPPRTPIPYDSLVAARSTVQNVNRARKSFYGIDIHVHVDAANALFEARRSQSEQANDAFAAHSNDTASISETEKLPEAPKKQRMTRLWTEKYRPRKFTDLVGDERTHRAVLRWLKVSWDPIVFPGAQKGLSKLVRLSSAHQPNGHEVDEKSKRKVLLLAGPPGLGKTTLAHVCARQAGYEVVEINASDERTKDVVTGRIRDMVGTENVKNIGSSSLATGDTTDQNKPARPVCVVVDEVDGVVAGSSYNGAGSGSASAGEGGFIKALLDLLQLDARNVIANATKNTAASNFVHRGNKRKADNFTMRRPLILIANDAYHPSLRLLRTSPLVETIHVRRPPLSMLVPRLTSIFEKERLPVEEDGVRALCEAAWGVSTRRQGGHGQSGSNDGDVRAVLVLGEWVAHKLRAIAAPRTSSSYHCLTRRWFDEHIRGVMDDPSGNVSQSLGRYGVREIVERCFQHGAGFSTRNSTMARTASKSNENVNEISSRIVKPSAQDIPPSAIETTTTARHVGVSEANKRTVMDRLREIIEACGEEERIVADLYTTYPAIPYQDTPHLIKPCAAGDWLHFSSQLSSRLYRDRAWDLAAYQAFPVLAFHHLFASSGATSGANITTTGPSIASNNTEAPLLALHTIPAAINTTCSHLQSLQSALPLALKRHYPSAVASPNPSSTFASNATLTTELVPYALRLLNPAAKATLVNGTAHVRSAEERARVTRAAIVAAECGVEIERVRVDYGTPSSSAQPSSDNKPTGDRPPISSVAPVVQSSMSSGWAFRLQPPLDDLATFPSLATPSSQSTYSSYALRSAIASERTRYIATKERTDRYRRGDGASNENIAAYNIDGEVTERGRGIASISAQIETVAVPIEESNDSRGVKRDFFGRPIHAPSETGPEGAGVGKKAENTKARETKRKGITMKELLGV